MPRRLSGQVTLRITACSQDLQFALVKLSVAAHQAASVRTASRLCTQACMCFWSSKALSLCLCCILLAHDRDVSGSHACSMLTNMLHLHLIVVLTPSHHAGPIVLLPYCLQPLLTTQLRS